MIDEKDVVMPLFPSPELVGERPWGREELLVLISEQFMLKKLLIKAGNKGGLQFHQLKNECGILISGELLVRFDPGSGELEERVLNAGDCFHFPPGSVHQEEAITDCVIIEASSTHFNDRVRVEHLYGLPNDGGLPTTHLNDIEIR